MPHNGQIHQFSETKSASTSWGCQKTCQSMSINDQVLIAQTYFDESIKLPQAMSIQSASTTAGEQEFKKKRYCCGVK